MASLKVRTEDVTNKDSGRGEGAAGLMSSRERTWGDNDKLLGWENWQAPGGRT